MHADDWIYAGEGNNSIAIANKDLHIDGSYYGCLLLIPKLQYRGGDRVHSRALDELHDTMPSLNIDHYVHFIENVMRPWFTNSYVSDKMERIDLDSLFLAEIASRIDEHRPIGRLKGYSPLVLSCSACLQRNFNLIYRLRPPILSNGISCSHAHNTYLSIELKVKSGLKGTSPFIPESRSIKRRFTKFFLTQLHKKSSTDINQSWGTFVEESTYDPILLFSGKYDNIMVSLSRLFKVPQNNLKVKINNKHIYGLDKVDMDHLLDGLSSLQVSSTDNFTTINSDADVLDIVIDCLSSILSEECILSRLEAMQKLDLLDVEGCQIVYERLLLLFGGSHVELETYLLDFFSSPLDDSIIELMRVFERSSLGSTKFPMSNTAVPSMILQLASCQVNDSMPIDIRQALRIKAVGLIEKETSTDHLSLLLKMWMMSLIAKDASVMVTLQPVLMSQATYYTNTAVSINRKGRRVQLQDSISCGVVCPLEIVDNRSVDRLMFLYSVGMVDIGSKPISKIWTKSKAEEAFCSQCINLLQTSAFLHVH